jgi:hypothetical protein
MLLGQHIGVFGSAGGGKGAKLMGPKFGGDGGKGKGAAGKGSSSSTACYACGQEGHRSAECPSGGQGKGGSSSGRDDQSYGGSGRLR